ncbi:MAG: hypothetical protein AABZ47_02415 [Planctomycetota bacterium]
MEATYSGPSGDLWFTTAHGVYNYESQTNDFQLFFDLDALDLDFDPSGIAVDKQHVFVIGHRMDKPIALKFAREGRSGMLDELIPCPAWRGGCTFGAQILLSPSGDLWLANGQLFVMESASGAWRYVPIVLQ